MRKLKSLLIVALTLICISCSMSAKSDEKNDAKETTAAQGEVISLDKAAFLQKVYNYEANPDQWKYEGDKPCIVDFYADWCGPCKKIAPVLKELAAQYKDQIVIYKVDTEKQKELAASFGIQALPTLLFIPLNGTPQVAQGALSKDQFVQQINSFLLNEK